MSLDLASPTTHTAAKTSNPQRTRRSRRAASGRANVALVTSLPAARQATPRATTNGALALLEEPQTLATPQALPAQRHILVVEDDPHVANLLRESLELEGEACWSVRTASEGRRALEIASNIPPDVVLLDMRLADLDGAEVYRRLRASSETRYTRIIFLSACTSLDLYQRGIEDGVLLRKPFDLPDLVAIVRMLLAD